MTFVIMGVTGAGKTLIGEKLASALGVEFFDGDDFHSAEAVAKMRSETPLTDADRVSWLDRIAAVIHEIEVHGKTAVVACSALKISYRERLRSAAASEHVKFVYLRITPGIASSRLRERTGHYMPSSLVASQFATLEEPQDALILDASREPESLVAEICNAFDLGGQTA